MTREAGTDQKFTGIVLAGGRGSRMGKEKGQIRWKGKTLIEHAIDIVSPLCEELIISANHDRYRTFGFPVVRDLVPDCGPMGGIYSALSVSETRNNLIIPVDTPLVTTEIYRHLISFVNSYDVIVPVDHNAYYQPLCAMYSKSIIPFMKARMDKGQFGFTPLLDKVHTKAVPFHVGLDFYQSDTFYNINSPEDLEAIS
jgi:molybdopterin-guanine dinucleotide biosynthesis protein A